MANLYEIDRDIENLIDVETGEVKDYEKFAELQMAKEEKIENTALFIKNLLSDAEQYEKEEKHFEELKRKAKNKAESLKNYLDTFLAGETYKSTKVKISYRKSESINVTDLSKLKTEFLKEYVLSADKAAIKLAIKAGEKVDGAELVAKQNIQVK